MEDNENYYYEFLKMENDNLLKKLSQTEDDKEKDIIMNIIKENVSSMMSIINNR